MEQHVPASSNMPPQRYVFLLRDGIEYTEDGSHRQGVQQTHTWSNLFFNEIVEAIVDGTRRLVQICRPQFSGRP